MNRTEAIAGHKARLANLTDTQARNLMEHAANKTPLLRTRRWESLSMTNAYVRARKC